MDQIYFSIGIMWWLKWKICDGKIFALFKITFKNKTNLFTRKQCSKILVYVLGDL